MKKLATALVCLALVAIASPPALAGSSLPSNSGVEASRVAAAVPPADPGASGAIIRDASCFENQLGGGAPWASVSAERVDLPFTMQSNGKYWNDIWISPQGALSHVDGGVDAIGIDVEDQDLIRSSEVYAPMLAGESATSWWNMDDHESPDFGQHLAPVYYGFTTFGGNEALCVTWLNAAPQIPVGPREWVENSWYPAGGYWTQAFEFDSSRRNSFQVLLVEQSDTGVGNFDIVYNYDTIQWQSERTSIDSTTGTLNPPNYAEAGWSLGIPSDGGGFAWRGYVDGRRTPDGNLNADPQLPYPQDHWWPQHGSVGNRNTYLDSSPTGLAVTHTTNTSQVGRHVFEIRGPRWHLALVLDRSVALTPEEYAAEIDAIADGLGDSRAFPVDGRFGISVTVVGGDAGAETVIPETTIFSAATMATLQAWIRTIPRATSAGGSDLDGLTAAVTGNDSFQTRDALRSVCQVTFAQPSSELRGDLPGLESSGAVDRVDLIGIGGHPGGNTGSSVGERGVEDRVFGGTGYVYVPSANELAEAWVGHCAKRLPLIRGMEVNQAVQDLKNDVPLIEDKPTVVRVFLESVFRDEPLPVVEGSLYTRDLLVPGAPRDKDHILVPPPDASFPFNFDWQRDTKVGSLNFLLSTDSLSGRKAIGIEMPGGATCALLSRHVSDPGDHLEHCEISVDYEVVAPLRLTVYAVDNGNGAPSRLAMERQVSNSERILPVPEILVEWRAFDDPVGAIDNVSLSSWIRAVADQENMKNGATDTYFHSFVTEMTGAAGSSFEGSRSAVSKVGADKETMAHEMGHAAGLPHILSRPTNPGGFFWTGRIGFCGERSEWDPTDKEWNYGRYVAGYDPPERPWLAMMSNFDSPLSVTRVSPVDEYWGIDTTEVGYYGFGYDGKYPNRFVDPASTGELMSYVNIDNLCKVPGNALGAVRRWISPNTYLELSDLLGERHPGDTVESLEPGVLFEGGSWIVSGTVSGDGDHSVEVALDEASGAVDPTGNDYGMTLRTYDASGNLIATLEPSVSVLELDDPTDSPGVLHFEAPVDPEGIARLEVVVAGEVWGNVVASEHAPVVEITSPAAGDSLTDHRVEVTWSASDVDEDELTFDVLYASAARKWQVLALGVSGDAFGFDRAQIAGSDAGAIMVIARDGFHSTYDEVGDLAVASNVPEIEIVAPAEGERYWGPYPLQLDAIGFDREDGAFPRDTVTWASDIDGVLDTSGYVTASELTLGVHTITATVTDSDGNTSTDSTTITILADEPTEPATPVAHHSGGAATSEPSPSASPGPQPSTSTGVDETPGAEPTPSPTPDVTASEPGEPGSGAWLWWMGLAVLVSAAAAAGLLWYRQRLTREP